MKFIKVAYSRIIKNFYSCLTIISPRLNALVTYRRAYGIWPNLKYPDNFKEKLLWLKIYRYAEDELVHKCADKYRVREYVKKCGFSEILNPLVGVYRNPNEVDFSNLPTSFVLKWSFGAGMNLICRDKANLNWKYEKKKLNKWMKTRYHLPYAELQYKNKERFLICEQYLGNPQKIESPIDYKVYCFSGCPECILVMVGRNSVIHADFYSTKWERINGLKKYNNIHKELDKPNGLSSMLAASKVLSKPFPFVRIDFYIVDNKVIFGEMTFTPAGGLYTSEVKIDDKEMGEYLNIYYSCKEQY